MFIYINNVFFSRILPFLNYNQLYSFTVIINYEFHVESNQLQFSIIPINPTAILSIQIRYESYESHECNKEFFHSILQNSSSSSCKWVDETCAYIYIYSHGWKPRHLTNGISQRTVRAKVNEFQRIGQANDRKSKGRSSFSLLSKSSTRPLWLE